MTRGALLLLDFLRSKGAATDRGCWWKQASIARETGIPLRTVQRYMAELRDAGMIQSKRRGSTSNLYTEAAEPPQMSFGFACGKAVDRCGKQTPRSAKVAEQIRQNGGTLHRTEAITPKGTLSPSPSSAEGSATERSAIERTIQAYGYTPSPKLIGRLMKKASHYAAQGFEIAAILERKRRLVDRNPSWKPRGDGWFTSVVEQELARGRQAASDGQDGPRVSVSGEVAPKPPCSSLAEQSAPPEPETPRKPPEADEWLHGYQGQLAALAGARKLSRAGP